MLIHYAQMLKKVDLLDADDDDRAAVLEAQEATPDQQRHAADFGGDAAVTAFLETAVRSNRLRRSEYPIPQSEDRLRLDIIPLPKGNADALEQVHHRLMGIVLETVVETVPVQGVKGNRVHIASALDKRVFSKLTGPLGPMVADQR